jgi:PAS domain S-box-containing protein
MEQSQFSCRRRWTSRVKQAKHEQSPMIAPLGRPLAEQPALQLIYDTAPIGLAFLTPDCRYLQINQRLTEICGISVQDHIGRSVRDCVPALAEAVEGIVANITRTGEPVTGIEVASQRADQREQRCWITYWHPFRGPNGDVVGVNVAAEEITERKRAEAALEANERATRLAKDAAEAALHHLQETQESLIEAEKLAALGRLVAGVAHEINNPLGVSLTVASTLERKSVSFSEEVARGEIKRSSLNNFVQAVRDASTQLVANLNRAAELVQSFKQVAVDQNQSEQRSFDIGELTEQVLTSLRPGVRRRDLTIRVECSPKLKMNSYPGAIGQVLTNLLLNAVTHAFPEKRGGAIEIKVCAFGNDDVELIFADDGAGMHASTKRQVFDPFFTTRRDLGCMGLGLHIVYNLVTNRLGGRLSLDSEVGRGTRVRLILPREPTVRLSAAARAHSLGKLASAAYANENDMKRVETTR